MNDKRSGKRGDWKQSGIESSSSNNRLVKIVFTGMLFVGILGFLVYWNWPTPDPKSELFVLAIGANADMPEIPFMDNDVAAIAKSFGENTETDSFDDAKSFQSSLEKIVESAARKLSSIDTAMLYVSGHGYNVMADKRPRAAILTTDYKPGHTEPILDQSGAVSIASLISAIAKIDVKTKIIFLDLGHFYQNPTDGVFVNDYVYALHEELKDWPKSDKEDATPDNIWIVTSSSMVEVPLYSTTKKRTLFNLAVESSLSSEFENAVYQEGQNVSELYASIFSFTKTHGGATAQTPLLYRVGTGLVDNSESNPDVNTTIAFYPKQRSDSGAEVDDGDKANAESAERFDLGNLPTTQLVGFQEKTDEKKAEIPSDSKAEIDRDKVEDWISASLRENVPTATSSNPTLIETEKKIRQSFSSFYAARYRIRQYFQVFEVTSFFQVEAADELHQRISDFSDVLVRTAGIFEPKPYEINEQVANRFLKQIAAVTAIENEVRTAISKVAKQLNKLTSFESENAFALLKNCELLKTAEALHLQKLTPLHFSAESDLTDVSSTPDAISFSWPLRDPWRSGTKNWQRLSNRVSLSQEVAQHYANKGQSINRTAVAITIPQSSFEVNLDALGQLRDAGQQLAMRFKEYFPEQGTSQFFTEHSRRQVFSVDESFFPEFKGRQNLISKLSLRIPKKQEVVSIGNLPDSLIVDRSGTKLRIEIMAQGEGLENVQIGFSFLDGNAPFKIEKGATQKVSLDKGIGFLEVALSSTKDAIDFKNNEFDMTVSVSGIEKKTSKIVRLLLPSPNRIDIAISRIQGSDSQLIVDSVKLPTENSVMRFEVFPNRADEFRISLLNQFYRAKKVRVSLFECAIQPDKILPERINNFVMTETLDGIRKGTIKEFLAAKLEMTEKMKAGKAVNFLSPNDPKLISTTKKSGVDNGGEAKKETIPLSQPAAGIANINNGFLCRITDLENPKSKWDYWFEVFPMDPNYVEVVPIFEDQRVAIQLQKKDGNHSPATVKLTWALVNDKNEKMLIENDRFQLVQTSKREITLMENVTSDVLQNARLKINVDGWPRKFIFDFDASRFRKKNDLREVRIVEISQSRPKDGLKIENAPPMLLVPLPQMDGVEQFGVRLSNKIRRPQSLNAHIEVDTSVIEHFGLDSKSEIQLSPGETPDAPWSLNYPRAILTTGKGNPTGLLSIFAEVTDFENLPVFVSGYTVQIRPALRLDLNAGSVTIPQPEQRILFDNQIPKINLFEIPEGTFYVGSKPKVRIQVNDIGVDIDQQKGIEFFTSKQRIVSLEELKSVKTSGAVEIGDFLEFELPEVKEPGELYLAARVSDRVGNSISTLTAFPRRDYSIAVLPKKMKTEKEKAASEDNYDLTVKVVVGSIPLNKSIHKTATFKIKIEPPVSGGKLEGNSYKFSGLKKGVKYDITGEIKISTGTATGVSESVYPNDAKGKNKTIELKLEL